MCKPFEDILYKYILWPVLENIYLEDIVYILKKKYTILK